MALVKKLFGSSKDLKGWLSSLLVMRVASWFVVVTCVAVFALRLYIAFSTPGLSGDEAYFHLRQVEHILNTGLPLWDDPLSFGGRTFFFSPVFHYLVALGSLVMPVGIAVKVVPNFFAVLLIPVIFGIARIISKQPGVDVFTAVFSAFVPVWFGRTINTLSPLVLVVPLLFFVIYAWLRSNEAVWRYWYIGALVLLSFTHPLALLFALGLALYVVLMLVEGLVLERTEIEMSIFSIFFVLWSQFVLYKRYVFAHGPGVIWQNIPSVLLSESFGDVTILGAIAQVGIIPVLYGVFVVYRYLFRRRQRLTYFLIAFALAATGLVWFRLIPVISGFILLGMFLMVLFSRWLEFFWGVYLPKTRWNRFKALSVFYVALAFLLTSGLPSWTIAWNVQQDVLPGAGLRAYAWIRDFSPKDAVVVAGIDEGHRVAALAQRKNVADSHFLLKRDARQRVHDINRIFGTRFGVEAAELLERYNAQVILLSPESKKRAGVQTLEYALNSPCFARTFNEGGYEVFVKHPFCKVEVRM